jgi:uncharacterized membrane-anchored protein YhcB (DUF1043 family)
LRNQKLDCADCQEIREANARLDAKLRAPTPREQELEAACVFALKELEERTNNFREAHQKLEAQNKALWELVDSLTDNFRSVYWHAAQGAINTEVFAGIAGNALAAIQKAKELLNDTLR